MSYELRTPLTSILGFSEMLTGGYAGDLNGQQGEYMRAILESADRLQGLIDNILDLAISDAGALELAIQPVEVQALVDAAGEAKADMMAEKQLGLTVRVPANARRIDCDGRRRRASIHTSRATTP